jgi:hypothetical protein
MGHSTVADHIPESDDNPLAQIVDVMFDQTQHLAQLVTDLQEREQWAQRRRVATDAQYLAVLRQITIPQLLDRIREGGT